MLLCHGRYLPNKNFEEAAAISFFLPDITEFAAGEHPQAYDL
jgi:hypothetical protein